jgi:hypothetical protein
MKADIHSRVLSRLSRLPFCIQMQRLHSAKSYYRPAFSSEHRPTITNAMTLLSPLWGNNQPIPTITALQPPGVASGTKSSCHRPLCSALPLPLPLVTTLQTYEIPQGKYIRYHYSKLSSGKLSSAIHTTAYHADLDIGGVEPDIGMCLSCYRG